MRIPRLTSRKAPFCCACHYCLIGFSSRISRLFFDWSSPRTISDDWAFPESVRKLCFKPFFIVLASPSLTGHFCELILHPFGVFSATSHTLVPGLDHVIKGFKRSLQWNLFYVQDLPLSHWSKLYIYIASDLVGLWPAPATSTSV